MSTSRASVDVLQRFLDVLHALRASAVRLEDWQVLRHAALTLPLIDGQPDELAARMRATLTELRERTRWWETAHGSVRYLLAASLVRSDESVSEFLAELKRVQLLFKEAKLSRSGLAQTLAFAILRESAPKRHVTAAQVARVRDLFAEIKKDHRWLLGDNAYPTIALLSTTDVAADEVARRVEAILLWLEGAGFGSRHRLIPVSQLLFFAPDRDTAVCGRFEALWKEFKAQGLSMNSGDYDEVGLLAFVPRTAAEVARTVLEHRETIRQLRPKPSRDASFSFACSTAFLALVGADPKLRKLSHTQAALQVRSVLVARQAAAAAAAS